MGDDDDDRLCFSRQKKVSLVLESASVSQASFSGLVFMALKSLDAPKSFREVPFKLKLVFFVVLEFHCTFHTIKPYKVLFFFQKQHASHNLESLVHGFILVVLIIVTTIFEVYDGLSKCLLGCDWDYTNAPNSVGWRFFFFFFITCYS